MSTDLKTTDEVPEWFKPHYAAFFLATKALIDLYISDMNSSESDVEHQAELWRKIDEAAKVESPTDALAKFRDIAESEHEFLKAKLKLMNERGIKMAVCLDAVEVSMQKLGLKLPETGA